MRRLFWVAVGAAGAVYAVRRLEQTARRYTPAGVQDQVEAAGRATTSAVREAVDRWRTSMDQREKDLVETLLVTPEGGDPHAFRRRRDAEDPWAAGPSSAPAARPTGRVDPEDDLDDF